jgi:MFS family permease
MVGISSILGGFLQMVYSVAGRYVPRRILLSGSNFFMAMGCTITGLADRFETLVTGNAVAGVGMAGTHPVSSSIITSKFEKKGVGSALSMFYGLGFVGNIISPILLSSIAVMAGWRYAYYLLALFFVIAGIITLWGLRGEPAADKISSNKAGKRLWDDIKSALKVKGAIPILMAQAFISGGTGMGVMTTWVPMYMRDATKGLGLDVGFAGIISSIATIGGVLGTIYLGKIADRRGYLKIATYSLITTTASVFLLTFYTGFSILLIPHLFILSMTTFSLGSMLQAYLARSASPAERDILLGLFFTFGFGVSSLWATLLGAVIDTYSFTSVWYIMVGAGIAAVFCLYIASRGQPPILAAD